VKLRPPLHDVKPRATYDGFGNPIDLSIAESATADAASSTSEANDDLFAAFDSYVADFKRNNGYDPYFGDDKFEREVLAKGGRLIIVSGFKGGVGKSTECAIFIEIAMAFGHRFIVIESDRRNKDVGPTFKNMAELRVIALDLTVQEGMENLLKIMAAGPYLIVVNTPAGMTQPFDEHGEVLKEALKTFGYELTVFFLMNSQKQSIDELSDFRRMMPHARVHPVLNLKEGARNEIADFMEWANSDIRPEIEAQGRTLVMPLGPMALMNRLEQDKVPFGTLAQDPRFGLFDRHQLQEWRKSMRAQFERVFKFGRIS
jgi:hypothetical protein